jgi:hypothetical protein
VTPADEDAEVRRCHGLWLAASDSNIEQVARPAEVDPHGALITAGVTRPTEAALGSRPGASLPPRNETFVGRESILDRLAGLATPWSPVTVAGPGGVGKTQVAIEFAHRRLGDGDLVWWVPAENLSSMHASLVELSRELDLPPRSDRLRTARAVLEHLEGGMKGRRWSLIYDNATSVDQTLQWIPRFGGIVMVTSRQSGWPGETVSLVGFERPESIAFIRAYVEDVDPADADRLAGRLDDSPLALRHVVGMQRVTGIPIPMYLALFDRHLGELLAQGAGRPDRNTAVISAQVAFRALNERTGEAASSAAQLLALFGYLGSGPFPVEFLQSGGTSRVSSPLRHALEQPTAMRAALAELDRFGLAVIHEGPHEAIEVHRLVQAWARDSLAEPLRRQARANVREILSTAYRGRPDDIQSWPRYAEIAPHVYPADLIGDKEPASRAVRETALDQARYLFAIGDYEGSARLASQMVSVWSRGPARMQLGETHEHTLLAARHLANATRMRGEYQLAHALDERLLTRLRHAPQFGDNHELTIAVASNVGFDRRLAGEFATANELDRQNFERAGLRYGPNHRETLKARNNVAAGLRVLGRFAEALEIDEALAIIWTAGAEPAYGQPLLWTLGSIAEDRYGLGQYEAALAILEERMLPAALDTMGKRHRHVILSRRIQANCMRKLGRLDEAWSLIREVHIDSRDQLGDDHEHTLALAMDRAMTCSFLDEGDAQETAEQLAAATVNGYRGKLGDRHPMTLVAQTNHAAISRARVGANDVTISIDRRIHGELVNVLGESHPFAIVAAGNLAVALATSGQMVAASSIVERAYQTACTGLGDQHSDTMAIAANLLRISRGMDDRDHDDWVRLDIQPPPM